MRISFLGLSLLAFVSTSASADPLKDTKFQQSPFAGVCQNVKLLSYKDYKNNKEFWEKANQSGGPLYLSLPDTGFWATMFGNVGSATMNDDQKKDIVRFLSGLGESVLGNVLYNEKITERQRACVDSHKGPGFFSRMQAEARELEKTDPEAGKAELEFYNTKHCPAIKERLEQQIAVKGTVFRVELAMMRHTAGLGSMTAEVLRNIFMQTYPGEKLELSDKEAEIVARLKSRLEKKVLADVEKSRDTNMARVNELLGNRVFIADALNDDKIENWFRNWYKETSGGKQTNSAQGKLWWDRELQIRKQLAFDQHYRNFTVALSEAPIVAYLTQRDPDEATLVAGLASVLKNIDKVQKDIEGLLAKTAHSGYYALSDMEKIDELISFLANGQAAKRALQLNERDCAVAAGLHNYISNKKTRNTAVAMVGLIAAGVFAPAIVGTAGTYVGVAGVGFTVTGASLTAGLGFATGAYSLYNDVRAVRGAARRVLVYTYRDENDPDSGLELSEATDLLNARNALVINAGIQAVMLAGTTGVMVYKNLIAANQSKYTTQAVMKQLVAAKEAGGAGLTENQARELVKNLGSSDGRVAHESVVKLLGLLGGDATEVRLFQAMVKNQLLDPATKSTFDSFSSRLLELRRTRGDDYVRGLATRMETFLGQIQPGEISPHARGDLMRVMLASSEFAGDSPGLVLRAAASARSYRNDLYGLALAYDQARLNMGLAEIRALAPQLRQGAAFERALKDLGIKDAGVAQAMVSCALGVAR